MCVSWGDILEHVVLILGVPGTILEVILGSWSTLKHQKAPQRPRESGKDILCEKKDGRLPGGIPCLAPFLLLLTCFYAFWGCVLFLRCLMDFSANMIPTSTIFRGGWYARNIAHSVRILVLRVFIQDGFRDLSGDPLGPHFGIILGPQSLHYTTFWVFLFGCIFWVI